MQDRPEGGHSLFRRLAATHLAVALATLAALALLLGGLLPSFFFRQKEQELIRYSHEVAELVQAPPAEITRADRMRLAVLGRLVGARIWVVAPDGRVVADSLPGRPPIAIRVETEEMEQVMGGAIAVRRGFFRGHFRVPVISVGRALPGPAGPAGAVYLHAPVLGVRSLVGSVFRLFGAAALLAAAVALGLGLWLSRRLADPLLEMSRAADELARGNFSHRVRVPASDDEVARLARSFNRMAAQLGDLERLRREFIANVSHELRSPLTSMRGFLQGILDGTVPAADRRRYLELAFDETLRLSRLVNDLLDLAALEAGEMQLELVGVDPAEAARRAAAKMEPQAAAKGVHLAVETAEGLPAVRADPDRLEQALINLLDNAIRFTPAGGSVTVTVRTAPDGVALAVADTGPGLTPEELERVWERFYKGDKARTRGTGGTGLGLPIVRQLVLAMGGTVTAAGAPGRGSVFTITLPLLAGGQS